MQRWMMDYPLTLHPFLERARHLFGRKQVVTRVGNETTRATYAEVCERVDRLASALRALGGAELVKGRRGPVAKDTSGNPTNPPGQPEHPATAEAPRHRARLARRRTPGRPGRWAERPTGRSGR